MNKVFKLGALFIISVFTFISCDEVEDMDIDGTATQEMAGDWYVKFTRDGDDIYSLGYQLISTYNTSANLNTEMWIDDHQHTWDFKVKSNVDYSNRTFSGTDLPSFGGYDVNVTITNGKIIDEGAITSGGNVTDSIYFDAEFSDDPGTVYTLSGYRRTGFAEDEH